MKKNTPDISSTEQLEKTDTILFPNEPEERQEAFKVLESKTEIPEHTKCIQNIHRALSEKSRPLGEFTKSFEAKYGIDSVLVKRALRE